MQQIVVNGKSIAYESRFVSQPVGSLIFVHGSGGDHHKWDDLMQKLPRQFSRVANDMPGHAASQGPLMKTARFGWWAIPWVRLWLLVQLWIMPVR